MNSNTQNAKIKSITEKTLIVGIDIGSETHYARAFDWRNYEYSKKPFSFNNDEEGFKSFSLWVNEIAEKHGKNTVIPGMEPTGHYWLNLGVYLQEQGMRPVHVNPHHVKKSKELDDNNPNKNDRKDPKTIAALVNEGRFSYPYIPTGIYAEIRILLADYEVYSKRMDELMVEIEKKLSEIPYIDKLLEINGVGIKTVSCFVAEVGDISRFDNPKQLQKLAGYAIVSNDSGKHSGESRISHRGRKRLRYALYEAAISVIGKNPEFKSIHEYYRTRTKNPLKKMQSVIAIACKLIRVFYMILTKGITYDGQKMLQDIVRPEIAVTA